MTVHSIYQGEKSAVSGLGRVPLFPKKKIFSRKSLTGLFAKGKFPSMKIHLHKNAKTTPAQRALIQADSLLNNVELAQKLGVSPTTVRKWKKRDSVYDRSHVPHQLPAVLNPLQEVMVVLIRLCLRSGLDDLHTIVRRFIYPDYARSSLNRCLKRYGISRLAPLPVHPDYRGSILYYSVVRLPDVSKTGNGEFIHIVLDCSNRLAHLEFTSDAYRNAPCGFMKTLAAHFPAVILGVCAGDLIDFSDTGTSFAHEAHTGFIHGLCKTRHFYPVTPDSHPSITQGLIEKTRPWAMAREALNSLGGPDEFKNRLLMYLFFYNTRLCQRTLKQKTPGDALRKRYMLYPGSFRFRPE